MRLDKKPPIMAIFYQLQHVSLNDIYGLQITIYVSCDGYFYKSIAYEDYKPWILNPQK